MKIRTYTRLVIELDQREKFSRTDDYGDDDTEILVDTLEITAGTIWAKGLAYKKKDHTLGQARKQIVLDQRQLPASLVEEIAGHFLDTLVDTPNIRLCR